MFFIRLILFILAWVIGLVIIKYREPITRTIGKNDLAEKYLGAGGTYNMWIIIGALVMIIGLLILLGNLAFLGL